MHHFWGPNSSFAPIFLFFFLKKIINIIFIYLLAPFILQNFKKNSQSQSRVMRMCHFRAQNIPICPEQNFLVQTIIISFIYLLALFIGQNLKKILTADQRYENVPFLGPNWSICPKQKLLCTILKKFFQRIQSYKDAQFLSPKWSIFPNENFFQKTC